MTVGNITGGVYIYAVLVNWDGISAENVRLEAVVQVWADQISS